MQDIFTEPEEFKRPTKQRKEHVKRYSNWDLLDYFGKKHVTRYGADMAVFYPEEAVVRIKSHIRAHKLPTQHFLQFVFNEMSASQVWANLLLGKDWPVKFKFFLESIKLDIDYVRGLESPLALPCYVEVTTFMNCLSQFRDSGGSTAELIKRFNYGGRMSDASLDFIYRYLEISDPELEEYFTEYRATKRSNTYENIDSDLTKILHEN